MFYFDPPLGYFFLNLVSWCLFKSFKFMHSLSFYILEENQFLVKFIKAKSVLLQFAMSCNSYQFQSFLNSPSIHLFLCILFSYFMLMWCNLVSCIGSELDWNCVKLYAVSCVTWWYSLFLFVKVYCCFIPVYTTSGVLESPTKVHFLNIYINIYSFLTIYYFLISLFFKDFQGLRVNLY